MFEEPSFLGGGFESRHAALVDDTYMYTTVHPP